MMDNNARVINNADFDRWNGVKKKRNARGWIRSVHRGEIWWATMGKNIGVEMNGKGSHFTRPVLVFKKLTRHGFLAIPLTSKQHDDERHSHFVSETGRDEYAALGQLRTISVYRLLRKESVASEEVMKQIENDLFNLYFK